MSLPIVTVWAERDSPRLRYVLDWLLGERLGLEYRLVHDKAEAARASHCIAYGWMADTVSIHASQLLWETGIVRHAIVCREWQGLYALYFNEESPCDIQFDMLAGIFYLLTRYEEYFGFSPDRHGRYPASQSILYGVLERPVIDEWVEAFRHFLEQVWSIVIVPKSFSFQPTYDIDIAWSYRFKGWKRAMGGALKDLTAMNWRRLTQRIRVMRGTEGDPYNSFVWIFTQHMEHETRPYYFVLAALKPSSFDKNISPRHPRMASLIKAFAEGSVVGLHPSYEAPLWKPKRLQEEKAMLESITGQSITCSRQHYIRLRFPFTYLALLSHGIKDDYSMGYSTQLGFRAGTGCPFLWYALPIDPEISAHDEGVTALRVHPFAFMDTTGHYDMHLSVEASFQKLYEMTERLVALNSCLVTVFHNFSLGTDEAWKGWRKAYEAFLSKISQLS